MSNLCAKGLLAIALARIVIAPLWAEELEQKFVFKVPELQLDLLGPLKVLGPDGKVLLERSLPYVSYSKGMPAKDLGKVDSRLPQIAPKGSYFMVSYNEYGNYSLSWSERSVTYTLVKSISVTPFDEARKNEGLAEGEELPAVVNDSLFELIDSNGSVVYSNASGVQHSYSSVYGDGVVVTLDDRSILWTKAGGSKDLKKTPRFVYFSEDAKMALLIFHGKPDTFEVVRTLDAVTVRSGRLGEKFGLPKYAGVLSDDGMKLKVVDFNRPYFVERDFAEVDR